MERGKKKIKEKIEGKNLGGEKEAGESNVSNRYFKQTKVVVVILIVLIASVFLAHWIIQESKKFDYNGINFYEEKEGSVIFYKSLLGFVSYSGENVPFILKLRTDPRELDKIPMDEEVESLKKDVILSVSPEISNCLNTIRTIMDFSMTLKAFGVKASAGTTDKNYSKEHNASLVNCEDSGESMVIVMKEGNETKITRYKKERPIRIVSWKESVIINDKDCYILEIKDCQVQESFERFILSYISNSVKT